MNITGSTQAQRKSSNQNIQVYVRVRPINSRERGLRSFEVVDVVSPREIVTRHMLESKVTKKFTFDRTFGPESRQVDVYTTVVAPLIEEVLAGYNCTVFAYGQTGTGKTHTMVGTECAELKSSWEDDSDIGIIPRALSHLFDELRLMEVEFSMRISYLELYNEELCDLLSTDDTVKIRIFDDSTKKGSVIIQGLEEIPVHSKDDVYKLLEKGKERRKTATTLMNAQSSRSHTVFSILVHIREVGIDGEEMLKIGKLNLVDLAGSENATKAGNEGIRVRETANINQSLLTLGRVITALVERTPHIPYRESKLTRLLQESLGGRTKTSIIATISPGHKDIEETLSTLQYADRAKSIQNKPEVNQKLTKRTMLKEYTEEIDKLKRDLMAARDKNGIYLAEETYNEMTYKMDAQTRELNEKMLLVKALKEEMQNKERLFSELSLNLVEKTTKLEDTEKHLEKTKGALLETKKVLNTTKRRYKEKKTLLESHIKTEKVLTDQAAQILEVADVATKDTHQLHHAIERRKNVDRQIESTCQQFSERMQKNFSVLDDHLEELEKNHKPKTLLVREELDNAIKTQNCLLDKSKANYEEIQKLLASISSESSNFERKYAELIKNLGAQHRDQLIEMFSEQKRIQLSQKETFDERLSEFIANNVVQAAAIKNIQETALHVFEQSLLDSKDYTDQLREQLSKCLTFHDDNVEVNSKLQEKIEEERATMEQERQFFEKLNENRLKRLLKLQEQIEEERAAMEQERQFSQIMTENRLKRLLETQQYLLKLATNYESMEKNLKTHVEDAARFYDKQNFAKNQFSMDFEKEVSRTLSLTAKSTDDIKKTQESNAMYYKENEQKIESTILRGNTNYGELEKSVNSKQAESTIMQQKQTNLLNEALSATDAEISKYTSKTSNQLVCAGSLNADLQNALETYAQQYKKQIEQCSSEVEALRQKYIKTYAPTGATPSKKDFVYPRVLVSTSPHNKIVRRLRQENDWSDLDTTATIDEEESVLQDDIENVLLNSVKEIPFIGTVLNSTPHNGNLLNSKNISSLVSPQTSALKERNSFKENSSSSMA